MNPQRLADAQVQHDFFAPAWNRIGPYVAVESLDLFEHSKQAAVAAAVATG